MQKYPCDQRRRLQNLPIRVQQYNYQLFFPHLALCESNTREQRVVLCNVKTFGQAIFILFYSENCYSIDAKFSSSSSFILSVFDAKLSLRSKM